MRSLLPWNWARRRTKEDPPQPAPNLDSAVKLLDTEVNQLELKLEEAGYLEPKWSGAPSDASAQNAWRRAWLQELEELQAFGLISDEEAEAARAEKPPKHSPGGLFRLGDDEVETLLALQSGFKRVMGREFTEGDLITTALHLGFRSLADSLGVTGQLLLCAEPPDEDAEPGDPPSIPGAAAPQVRQS